MNLGRIFERAPEAWDLWRTLQPGLRGARTAKLFGAPGHGGGPRTKHAQLSAVCAGPGEPYGTVICLSSVRVPLPFLRFLRRRGARVVVNQNGVYYPLWCPADYAARNRFLAGLNAAADHAYFQSEFAVDSFRRWVGEPPAKRSVLHNAVDREFFHPDWAPRTQLRALVFLDQRESTRELWRHMAAVAREIRDLRWVFLGRRESAGFERELRALVPDAEFVLDPSPTDVARVTRSCDVALQFVHNDVCPNKVLECLASGVYVLCSSAGGAKELVRHGGGEVLPVSEGYESRAYPTISQVRAALDRFRAHPGELRREAWSASEAFDLAPWLRAMTEPDDNSHKPG